MVSFEYLKIITQLATLNSIGSHVTSTPVRLHKYIHQKNFYDGLRFINSSTIFQMSNTNFLQCKIFKSFKCIPQYF